MQLPNGWTTTTLAVPPADQTANNGFTEAYLTSVSCYGAGDCMTVGYVDTTTGHIAPISYVETHGTWSAPALLPLPAEDTDININGVSCAGAGFCVAVAVNPAGAQNNSVETFTASASDPTPGRAWPHGRWAVLPDGLVGDGGGIRAGDGWCPWCRRWWCWCR